MRFTRLAAHLASPWIIVVAFTLALPHLIGQSQNSLTLTITSDKPSYSLGEPVNLEYRFDNLSGRDLLLDYSRLLDLPRTLKIHGPDGRLMRSQRVYHVPDAFSPHSLIALPVSGFVGATRNLLEDFLELRASGNLVTFSAPGRYSVEMLYEQQRSPSDFDLWKGRIESNTIYITIDALTGEDIHELKREVRAGGIEQQRTAVTLLRSQRKLAPEEVITALRSEDKVVRHQAGLALWEEPELLDVDTLLSFLESDDVELRSFAALALGKRGELQAVPALIRLADPEGFPGSYRAPARALVSLEDPRAIEVLKKVVQHESIKELRSVFEKAYNGLLLKQQQE